EQPAFVLLGAAVAVGPAPDSDPIDGRPEALPLPVGRRDLLVLEDLPICPVLVDKGVAEESDAPGAASVVDGEDQRPRSPLRTGFCAVQRRCASARTSAT